MQKFLEAEFHDKNPLMAAKDFGDHLMIAGEWIIIGSSSAYIVGSAAKGGADGVTDSLVGKAANFLTFGASSGIAKAGGEGLKAAGMAAMLILTPIGVALVSFGATMSIYIPMIPYIVWIGCILGWFILLVEAVFAAPLWAVMHLSPDGHDWTGGAGQGYMLIAGLVLRPALMVMGLAASFVVLKPLGDWINATFFEAFFSAMGASMVGLVSAVVMAGMYCGLMMWLIHKIFALTHIIPDQLLRWMGGGGSNLGEYAGSAMGEGKQMGTAGAAALGGYLGSAGGRVMDAQRLGREQKQASFQEQSALGDISSRTGPANDLADKAEKNPDSLKGMSSASLSEAARTLSEGDKGLEKLASDGPKEAASRRQTAGLAGKADKLNALAKTAAAREAGQQHFAEKAGPQQVKDAQTATESAKVRKCESAKVRKCESAKVRKSEPKQRRGPVKAGTRARCLLRQARMGRRQPAMLRMPTTWA